MFLSMQIHLRNSDWFSTVLPLLVAFSLDFIREGSRVCKLDLFLRGMMASLRAGLSRLMFSWPIEDLAKSYASITDDINFKYIYV